MLMKLGRTTEAMAYHPSNKKVQCKARQAASRRVCADLWMSTHALCSTIFIVLYYIVLHYMSSYMHAWLCSFRARGAHEWEAMVAASRPSFTAEFFAHAENLVRAAAADPAEQEGARPLC